MSRIGGLDQISKETWLREWTRRKLGGIGHELRVGRIGQMLFDMTGRWHGLGLAESRLLAHAALVHDVGKAEGTEDHARRGAEMIKTCGSLPVGDAERRRLAFLTRYHRGRVPAAGLEEYLEHGADDVRVMRIVLGLLRAADALDSRSMEPPQLVVTIRGRALSVHGYVKGDGEVARAQLGKAKKFRLMEETLACKVSTVWVGSDEMELVS